MSRHSPAAARPISSTNALPRRLGIEIVLEHLRIEQPQQRVVGCTQVADLDRRRARLAEQIDEQRSTGAVAILDAGRVYDHLARGRVVNGAANPLPKLLQRGCVEPSRQGKNALAFRRIRDGKRSHAYLRPDPYVGTSSSCVP